jgi:hypothetical protein
MSATSGILTIILTLIKTFLNWLIGKRTAAEKKEKQEKIENAETKLKDACENGDLGDLIDASINLGKAHKK